MPSERACMFLDNKRLIIGKLNYGKVVFLQVTKCGAAVRQVNQDWDVWAVQDQSPRST